MDHISIDAALIPRPIVSHPLTPAQPGGCLLVRSTSGQGIR
jgi:hypothetical protein